MTSVLDRKEFKDPPEFFLQVAGKIHLAKPGKWEVLFSVVGEGNDMI